MSNYVCIKSEPQLWTVGFYDPELNWHPVEDFSSLELAEEKVAILNGSVIQTEVKYPLNRIEKTLEGIKEALERIANALEIRVL